MLLRTIKEWRAADGNDAKYIFVAPRDTDQHITPEGLEKFYRIALGLAGRHSPHSWRAAFSTICREASKRGEVIESPLDHVVGTKIESAYDRSARLELRRALMRWYENKLIAARDGAQVIALSSVKSLVVGRFRRPVGRETSLPGNLPHRQYQQFGRSRRSAWICRRSATHLITALQEHLTPKVCISCW